jgi:hypothetical protein
MRQNPLAGGGVKSTIVLVGCMATLLTSCGATPKSTLKIYLNSGTSSNERYKTICEKDYVSIDELKDYYLSPLRRENQMWKTNAIREVDWVENKIYLEADHTYKGKVFTPTYLVLNRQDGEPCVSWTRDGRFPSSGRLLVRYPSDKITIWTKVELSDYYNYDFSDMQDTHMSLKIISDDDTWNWKTVYVPYDGNDDLYDYVSTNEQAMVKMIVSREYTLNLDPGKVDRYNEALFNSKEFSDDENIRLASSISDEENSMEYEWSKITDGEDILYAPTAIPVILK